MQPIAIHLVLLYQTNHSALFEQLAHLVAWKIVSDFPMLPSPPWRKYSIEMVANIHTGMRRCTVMLNPHPNTNSQGYVLQELRYNSLQEAQVSVAIQTLR